MTETRQTHWSASITNAPLLTLNRHQTDPVKHTLVCHCYKLGRTEAMELREALDSAIPWLANDSLPPLDAAAEPEVTQ